MAYDLVPARPLRQWLVAWQLHTGDPAHLIARGFDLDPGLVADLLGPEPPRMLQRSAAERAMRGLGGTIDELWAEIPARLRVAFDRGAA